MDLESTQNNALAKLPLPKQEDGNSFKPVVRTTTNADGTSTLTIPGAVTADEKIQTKNDLKARSILMMKLPSEHLLTFNQYKDAKDPVEAIEARFDGNEATKKTQKTLLSRCYEISMLLDQSHLTIYLFPASKIVKPVSHNSSSLSTASSTDNTARLSDATIYAFLANQPNGSQVVHEDLEQIHEDDLEEMDLKWQLTLLNEDICESSTELASQENWTRNQDSSKRTVNVEEYSSKAMLTIDGVGVELMLMNRRKYPYQLCSFAFYDLEVNKSVSENSSNEIKKTSGAPIIEDWVFDYDEDETSELANVQKPKQADQPRKISQNPRNNRKRVTSAVGEQGIDAVKSKACWVWRPKLKVLDHVSKNSRSYICKQFDYVDPTGRVKISKLIGYYQVKYCLRGGLLCQYAVKHEWKDMLYQKCAKKSKTLGISKDGRDNKVTTVWFGGPPGKDCNVHLNMEKALWVELKRLFEPDKDDVLWKLQRYMRDSLTWRLYGSCASVLVIRRISSSWITAYPFSVLDTSYQVSAAFTMDIARPTPVSYLKKRLTMEEIVNKFIEEGKREHEEIDAFIREFKTTNELLLKERNNSLSELEFEVYGLSRAINKAQMVGCEAKGVTTRGGKSTTEPIGDNTDYK
ncbi:hypothetical protein Tco_0471630 [Tanacetum coccineum]